MTVFVIPIVAALLVTIILSVMFRGSDKVDKGFKLNYFKLSYRRKLIKTLISLPVITLALIVIYSYTEWSMAANVLLGLLFLTIYFGSTYL
ncbi:ATPase [Oceanobacillus alkalisoli]|uniref:ATPase n=1 Tax=Oceanobacillus alkalisoli TaxID=2925113 RepID=UPI001EF1198F|nr:ATPase [Oceanobacillus alkalisoli]MCF3944771.1 ATPase [Oceanobacillus alkalisoli]MCG5105269.1 ATPase [Oceanobacillus alkalisoli]